MKKYIKIKHNLYEAVDIAGAVFVTALVAMLASAAWLSLDWLARNNISTWAIVCLITGMAVAATVAAIFRNYNK